MIFMRIAVTGKVRLHQVKTYTDLAVTSLCMVVNGSHVPPKHEANAVSEIHSLMMTFMTPDTDYSQ